MNTAEQIAAAANRAFDAGDHLHAIALFEEADGLGSADAALMLGWIKEAGWNTERSTDDAKYFYHRAVERGNAQALFYLGKLLVSEGRVEESRELFQKAASLGEPGAALHLGRDADASLDDRLYWLEKGVPFQNVYCLALSGRLMLRKRSPRHLFVGLARIVKAFGVTVLYGLRHRSESALWADRRFQN